MSEIESFSYDNINKWKNQWVKARQTSIRNSPSRLHKSNGKKQRRRYHVKNQARRGANKKKKNNNKKRKPHGRNNGPKVQPSTNTQFSASNFVQSIMYKYGVGQPRGSVSYRSDQNINQNQTETETQKQVNNFLQAVAQKYGGHKQAKSKKPKKKKKQSWRATLSSLEKKLFQKLKKFSLKSVEEMMSKSGKDLQMPHSKSKRPRSVDIPWKRLKLALVEGLRGPDVTR